MVNASPSASPRYVATTIFGGVPIRVTIPPRMVANDSGISVKEGLRLARLAASISTGISNARAATLFISADNAAPITEIRLIWVDSAAPPRTTNRAISSTAPEFARPRLTTSTMATITVAGCPKPAKAASVSTRPLKTAIVRAANAMRSYRIRPQTSITNSSPNTMNRPVCW